MIGREHPLKIVFAGTGDIGLPSLKFLLGCADCRVISVITQPDKPTGRSQILTPSPIKLLAQEQDLPILQPVKIRHPEAVAKLVETEADLMIVMAYGQILPRSVLDFPQIGCVNLHASLLPRHRGAAPIQSAILAGDSETGITVMYMAEGLDTGDMILKRSIPIRRRETGGTLHDRLAELAALALEEALPKIANHTSERVSQNETLATYAAKLTREDGQIDWAQGSIAVERKIRAMNPWPGAFTRLLDRDGKPKKLKVFSAIAFRRISAPPASIVRADDRGILVGTGTGAVLLTQIQMEGKRRMKASEFLQGFQFPLQIQP